MKPPPHTNLRRDWVVTPLCGVGTTFSGSSKDPSRPRGGGRRPWPTQFRTENDDAKI